MTEIGDSMRNEERRRDAGVRLSKVIISRNIDLAVEHV
jgi:hypothetical protein